MRKRHEFRFGLWTALSGVAALGLVLSAALAAPAPGVVGDWQGALDPGTGSLQVVLHFTQLKDGSLAGTLDSPGQGATGIVISTITFHQPDVHFAISSIGSSYEGKIGKDNSEIAGQWKQGGASLPLSFKRTK